MNVTEAMPLSAQWRLAAVAEALLAADGPAQKLTATLRGQLQARAEYIRRGRIIDQPPPSQSLVWPSQRSHRP